MLINQSIHIKLTISGGAQVHYIRLELHVASPENFGLRLLSLSALPIWTYYPLCSEVLKEVTVKKGCPRHMTPCSLVEIRL
jgi:hypothetical protein